MSNFSSVLSCRLQVEVSGAVGLVGKIFKSTKLGDGNICLSVGPKWFIDSLSVEFYLINSNRTVVR